MSGEHGIPPRAGPIVFVMAPEYSALNASFAFARRLHARGHSIMYVGPTTTASHVTRQGFAYSVLRPWWPYDNEDAADRAEQPATAPGWRRALTRHLMRARHYERTLAAFDAWVEGNDPALVCLDPLNWTLSPPLLRRGIPIVNLSITLASAIHPDGPPVFSKMIPSAEPVAWERLRYLLAWLKVAAVIAAKTAPALVAVAPPRYWGRNPIALVWRHGGRLRWGEYGPRLAGPELVTAPRQLEFPSVARSSRRVYLGSCVDEQRSDGPFDWPAMKPGAPLVYCSLGTYSASYVHALRLFRAFVEAMTHLPDWHAIVQVSSRTKHHGLGGMPSNVRVAEWVPQLEVLKRARVFVTQGGCGAIREAVHCGVPMLVFPCWYDQYGNAARVVYHGIGVRGDIATVDARQIRAQLERIVSGGYTVAIRRLSASIRQEHGQEEPALVIEQMLDSGARIVSHSLETAQPAARASVPQNRLSRPGRFTR